MGGNRTQEEFEERLRTSTTVYVGNLSFYTTEEQIHEVFSRCGELKRIVGTRQRAKEVQARTGDPSVQLDEKQQVTDAMEGAPMAKRTKT
eukprot:jgi/Pico_ML_1/55304/g1005.t1